MRPPVWTWFVAYSLALAVVYLLCVVGGAFALFLPFPHEKPDDRIGRLIFGVIMIVMGLPLAALFGAAPFLPRKPWAWIYGIVLICIGMTSACCMPACVPLLIYWIKPETKQYFESAGPGGRAF